MKKFFIIFSILSLSPFIALATSGACSSHGGVNCSAQISRYDKVICNDGWTNSSVYYYQADECQTSSCTPPSGSGCRTESDYSAKQVQLNSQGGYLGYTASHEGVLQQCRDEINSYQSALQSYNNCLSNESSSSSNYSGPSYSSGNIDSYINSEMQSYCVELYGDNAGYNINTKHCSCNEGFLYFNNKCLIESEARNQSCIKDFGEFSRATPNQVGKCSCLEGYGFDINNQCILIIKTEEILLPEKNTSELLEKINKVENTQNPVAESKNIPKTETKKSEKAEQEKDNLSKILEESKTGEENLVPSPQIQAQTEIKSVQKLSIFKRIKNWIINLFN